MTSNQKKNKFISIDETTTDVLLDAFIDTKKTKYKPKQIIITNSIKDDGESEFKDIEDNNSSSNNINTKNIAISEKSKKKKKYETKKKKKKKKLNDSEN